MPDLNTWADVSSIANNIQEDAVFVVRETALMQSLVRVYTDARGDNPRKLYQYNQSTAGTIIETDDLTSSAFAPALLGTLTPIEVGLQFFVTDRRRDSELPETIISDGGRELGLAAADYVESALITDMASLTGGTIGAAGTVISWSYLAAAIARAKHANKSMAVPLACVVHGYQWAVLAKAASVAGASVAVAPGFQEEMSRSGKVSEFLGVPIYQVQGGTISGDDFVGGVFPRDALAIDWRRPVQVEGQRDASRRGTEFNMSAVFAHGVARPTLGVKFTFDASAPSS